MNLFTKSKTREEKDNTPNSDKTSIQEIRAIVKTASKNKKTLENLNKTVKHALDIRPSILRSITGKVLSITPKKIQKFMPLGVSTAVAEEGDVLVLIEGSMRTNITSIQNSLKSLAGVAKDKANEIQELLKDLETAKTENWDAKKLLEYMAGKTDIVVCEEVSTLLSTELNIISEDEQENRKIELLNGLEDNARVGLELMKLIEKFGICEITVFGKAVSTFYGYVKFYKPISVIKESSKILTETNETMYNAKEALTQVLEASLTATEDVLDALSITEKYSVVTPDAKKMLEDANERLSTKLTKLGSVPKTSLEDSGSSEKKLVAQTA